MFSVRAFFLTAAAILLSIIQPVSGGKRDGTSHSIMTGAGTAGRTFVIKAQESRFIVHVGVTGLLSAFGHNHTIAIRDFTGEAHMDPDNLQSGSMNLSIKSGSLAVMDKISEKDRSQIEETMRTEVLQTSKYPEIVFKSTQVSLSKEKEGQYQAKIFGKLTLRGVTRSGLIYARVNLSGDTMKAHGAFPLKQTDYGIKPVSVAGGSIKVKDDLSFTFDLVARAQ